MKKLLYILTMLFNAAGSLCVMSLFVFAKTFCFQNLFLILAGSVVFIVSFTMTTIDYNNNCTQNINTYKKVRYNSKNVNYRDYFVSNKSDFIVS